MKQRRTRVPKMPAAPIQSHRQILLVDANAEARALVTRELHKDMPELQIIHAPDQASLDAAIEGKPCDLVITDFQLRSISGLDVLKRVKSRWPDTPVIMFAGTEQAAVEAMGHGLSGYVVKSPRHMPRLRKAVQTALASSAEARARLRAEHMLTDALQSMEDGLILFDAEDRMILCNDQLRRMYPELTDMLLPGTTFTDILKVSLHNQRVELDGEKPEEWLQKRLATHRRAAGSIVQQLNDGRWVLIKERRSHDGGYINIYTDITAIKQRELELERLLSEHIMLAAATRQSSAGVVVVDVQSGGEGYPIIYVNPAFERITGYSSADVCGRDWRLFAQMAATSDDVREKIRDAFNTRESTQIDVVNHRKNGEKFWNSLAISPVFDERGILRFYVGVLTDITDRVQISDMLEERTRMLGEAEHLAHLGHWRWDIPLDRMWRSEEVYLIRGMTPDEAPGDFRGTLNTFHPDDRERVSNAISGVAVNHQGTEFEARVLRPDGEIRHVRIIGQYSPPTRESNEAVFGIFQDISAQKQQDAALRRSERRYRRLMEANPHGIKEIALDGTISYANQASHKMLGYQRGELIGKSVFDFIADPLQQAESRNVFSKMINAEIFTHTLATRQMTADGRIIDVQVDSVVSRNEAGRVNGVISVTTDITERVQSEKRLRYLAFYDPLTGLGNRALLNESLRERLANRSGDACVAVVLFNIDGFKLVNDALGHDIGDSVLREFGSRLASAFGGRDVVARLGADEFAAIMAGDFDREMLRARVEEIKHALEAPLQLAGSRLDVRLSTAVAVAPGDGNEVEELLRNADSALLEIKRDEPGGLRFYSAEMKTVMEEFLMLRGRLRSAVLQGEFHLEYQPQVELGSGRILGLEALLRWRTEDGELIPPGKFIPVAEQSGDIIALGGWTLESACRQGVAWSQLGIEPTLMTVNISARQFLQDNLVDMVSGVLRQTGYDPHRLQLELTETALMTHNPAVLRRMRALTDMGISFSLDDFGTGYSSLSYLSRLPIGTVKIDRSFVVGMSIDARHVAIVSAVVAMSRALDIKVVAEGVEEARQVEYLRTAGCGVAQGFFYSRPVSADACTALLRAGVIQPSRRR